MAMINLWISTSGVNILLDKTSLNIWKNFCKLYNWKWSHLGIKKISLSLGSAQNAFFQWIICLFQTNGKLETNHWFPQISWDILERFRKHFLKKPPPNLWPIVLVEGSPLPLPCAGGDNVLARYLPPLSPSPPTPPTYHTHTRTSPKTPPLHTFMPFPLSLPTCRIWLITIALLWLRYFSQSRHWWSRSLTLVSFGSNPVDKVEMCLQSNATKSRLDK